MPALGFLVKANCHDGQAIHDSFLSPKGDRLVTLGEDETARLWDPITGRQIAILRRGNEHVLTAG